MEEIKLFRQVIKCHPISQLVNTILCSASVCYTFVQKLPGFSVSLWADIVTDMVEWFSVNILKCNIKQC